MYKSLKEAYGFRLRAVHGATFKSKDTMRIIECAKLVDQVCRELVYAYFDPSTGLEVAVEGPEEKMTEYFLGRVLGEVTASTTEANTNL